jgi:anaerobic sulfite reductase subunit B
MATAPTAEPVARGAMAPEPYRVVSRAPETADTWTLLLEPLGEPIVPAPGQFNMLYAFGVGEVPISTSAAPEPGGELVHTIRAVGPVTRALCAAEPGDVIGVRGPFGTAWPLEQARGGDLVIVAGGIGLAPVRPAIYHALTHRDDYSSFCLLVGARTPDDLLFVRELEDWRGRFDVEVGVTVDSAVGDWHGRVGVVPRLIPSAAFDPAAATALVVGPEIMMTFTAKALLGRGIPKERIYVSMERNMRCGVGHCGHCQLGPVLICRDGPVFRYDEMEALMEVREL